MSTIDTVIRGCAVNYFNRIDNLISMKMFLEKLSSFIAAQDENIIIYVNILCILFRYNIISVRLPTVLATVPCVVHTSPYSLHVG